MFSFLKQTSHKRDLPSTFEGNKQTDQQGATTTFKNWAAKVQIYMSLEDHNLATIMEDTKTLKTAIVGEHYIDYALHQQGMGQQYEEETLEMEYMQMKQYLQYLIYHRDVTHLQMLNDNTSTSSRKPSTITAESYSTS
eukprot:1189879-Amphidinium_carterae.1